MIFSSKYYLNYNYNPELFKKLRNPIFLKTELDVIYNDFVRWENSGLLLDKEVKINTQRKYSYVEYTWVKVVEQLRKFGFDYDFIKTFKDVLDVRIDDEFYKFLIKEKRDELLEFYTEEEINKGVGNSTDDDPTFFEAFIINVINYNDIVSILFFHDKPGFCVPFSSETIKEFEKRNANSEYMEYMKMSHVSVSLNEIVKKFVINDIDKTLNSEKFTSILSSEEHSFLKIVRKKYKNLKSIRVKFKDNKMSFLEVKTIKKAKAESRLLEYIKKGDYLSIEIEAVDGNIVNFENTQKYKL
jgi:DNA-binding transcriptional MerR regulator